MEKDKVCCNCDHRPVGKYNRMLCDYCWRMVSRVEKNEVDYEVHVIKLREEEDLYYD